MLLSKATGSLGGIELLSATIVVSRSPPCHTHARSRTEQQEHPEQSSPQLQVEQEQSPFMITVEDCGYVENDEFLVERG
jgi:hypothetical protein